MRKLIVAVLMSAVFSGCTNMVTRVRQNESSGAIGCPPGQIEISDTNSFTWTAMCRGRKFYCSSNEHSGAICHEELGTPGK